MKRARFFGFGSGLLAASIWGGMYVVSDVVLEAIPPFTLLSLRLLLGIAAWGLAFVFWGRSLPRNALRPILSAGFIGYGISLGLQFVGTQASTAANGALITATVPAFSALFGRLILQEPLTRKAGLALLVSMAGVLMVIDPAAVRISRALFWGNIALLGAGLSWSLYSVLIRRVTQGGSHSVGVSFLVLFGGLPLALPLAGWELTLAPALVVTPPLVWGVIYLGVVSTALAVFLWTYAFASLPASEASLTFFAQPLVGVLLSALLLEEEIRPWFALGGGLIGLGLWLVRDQARGEGTI